VLTFGFGPATRNLSLLFIPITILLLAWTAVMLADATRRNSGPARIRVLGVTAFFATGVTYAVVLGWGRAALIREVYFEWPLRYMLLVVPLYWCIYLAWEFCASAKHRLVVQFALVVGIAILTPLNTAHGLSFGKWVSDGWDAVKKDIRNVEMTDFVRR